MPRKAKDRYGIQVVSNAKKEVNKVQKKHVEKQVIDHDKRVMIRSSAFHRDLAKFCCRMENPRLNMESYINHCIEVYTKENHPDLYAKMKRYHDIK